MCQPKAVSLRAGERLLLLAHPRSGSSNLYEILQMHPALKICMEPLNENFMRWAPGNKNYRELVHDWASLEAVLDEIFTDFNGLKLLSYQLPEEWVRRLIGRRDFRVLFIRRINVLQAVVSVLIAEQRGSGTTGTWIARSGPTTPIFDRLTPRTSGLAYMS
jgi:hypothetical protein